MASSVVVLFAGLLGSHGVLGHGGQGRSRHAGGLHDLDVLAGEARHQLLARRAASEEEVVGDAGQDRSDHRPEPVNLEGGRGGEDGSVSSSRYVLVLPVEAGGLLTQWFSQKPATMAGPRERAGFMLPPENRA